MKDWIKVILRETLDELSTTLKPEFGAGMYHTVFPSKKNPNILYKMGKERIVKEWTNIFNKHPDLFPKVYRVFPSKKYPNNWVAEVEKLDSARAEKEFNQLDEIIATSWLSNKGLRIFLTNIYREGSLEIVKNYIQNEGVDAVQKYIPLIEKWAILITKIKNVAKAELDEYPDIHAGNFAYDSHNNIKAIDI
jgi:hypothetical protein